MSFWRTFRNTYGDSAAFLMACPLLALVPACFEFLQHVVEVRIGMYDSIAAAQDVEHDTLRMAFGYVKVLALLVPTYWIVRFASTRDAHVAKRLEPRAIRLFSGFLAYGAVASAIQLFFAPRTGVNQAIALLVSQVLSCLLVAWGPAAAMGNTRAGPAASVSLMWRHVPWTALFCWATVLPVMIPHYLLAMVAISAPKALLWPVLLVDSLLVSFLSSVVVVSGFHAATRAAKLAGVSLSSPQMAACSN